MTPEEHLIEYGMLPYPPFTNQVGYLNWVEHWKKRINHNTYRIRRIKKDIKKAHRQIKEPIWNHGYFKYPNAFSHAINNDTLHVILRDLQKEATQLLRERHQAKNFARMLKEKNNSNKVKL